LAIAQGTPNLVEAMQWYETNLGAYIFGDKVASVSVAWGGGAFGGMEHHPLWHLGSSAMADESTHAHEAAHGWFGNGIRIACWEDFVLSEGTVSYLTARALTDVGGAQLGFNIWQDYSSQLDNEIAWPTGCNEIDILNDGLFGAAPYVKGAYFYRAVENKVGTAELDAALKAFYTEYVGKAARMQDMLDTILAETGYDATTCADMWLRSQAVPTETTCP